ncbi:MAG: DUF1294 domain-containing protein [Candidatus Omnitrophica bacterium]|nr:DUF1294 domain-containing protein [Candidatus Omnitrophota bacterium]MCB9720944.1 DUF1294 domain-containing protein [Candidatus Omnitrophota bacterium]
MRYLAWYLLAVNIIAIVLYGLDKWQARRHGARIAEWHLLAVAAAGGTPGAWCGQQIFRHKTRKKPFLAAFWGIVAVQAVILVWIWRQ